MKPLDTPTDATPTKKQGVLLLVEDERDNVMVAQLQLRKRYDVLVAMSDEEACRHLRESASKIDAVLMDIQLRGSSLDGLELARAMRKDGELDPLPDFARDLPGACANIPILFVTAFANNEGVDFESVTACSVVGKPINFSELNLKLTQLYLSRISSR